MSPIIAEAQSWSELPALLEKYKEMVQQGDGVSRIFGYASIIPDHKNEKPTSSESIPNEKARLEGMEVAMNVLAAGQYEFRGTRGTFTDGEGKKRAFANVGVYAGLEPAQKEDGYADGQTITTSLADMEASLKAYIKRELGEPPAKIDPSKGADPENTISVDDVFDKNAAHKFKELAEYNAKPAAKENTDQFGMYKFQIVEVQTNKGKVPAITVATNEKSKFAFIGKTPMQTAQLILDGQGYIRKSGQSKKGGSALDYFKKSVMDVTRNLGLNQQRLEKIDAAVEELSAVYAKAHAIIEQHLPEEVHRKAFEQLINDHPDIVGIASPRMGPKDNVNKRPTVYKRERDKPENEMPHTADEKFALLESY